jgi:hypothetical protein
MHTGTCVWSTSTPPTHRLTHGIVQHFGIGTPRWRNSHWTDILPGVQWSGRYQVPSTRKYQCGQDGDKMWRGAGFSGCEVVPWRPGLAIIG